MYLLRVTVKVSAGTAVSLKPFSAAAKFSLLPCTSGKWSQTCGTFCVCADVGSQLCIVAKTPGAGSKASRSRPGQGIPNQMLLSARPRASHRAANSILFLHSGKEKLPPSALTGMKCCLLMKHFLFGIVTDVKNDARVLFFFFNKWTFCLSPLLWAAPRSQKQRQEQGLPPGLMLKSAVEAVISEQL